MIEWMADHGADEGKTGLGEGDKLRFGRAELEVTGGHLGADVRRHT